MKTSLFSINYAHKQIRIPLRNRQDGLLLAQTLGPLELQFRTIHLLFKQKLAI